MRKIAISDIHGCNATFQALLKKIKLQKKDQLFLLGDYIDRGPASKAVFDTIFNLINAGFQIQCTRGNHEEMLISAMEGDKHFAEAFLRNGGEETLISFGVKDLHEIPANYLDFMANLPYWLEVEDFILVHAGLQFKANSNPFENLDKMLWIRNWYADIDYQWLGKRFIVHGHTPTPMALIQKQKEVLEQSRVLNIDAGCIFALPGYIHLCAFDLSNRLLYFEPRHSADMV